MFYCAYHLLKSLKGNDKGLVARALLATSEERADSILEELSASTLKRILSVRQLREGFNNKKVQEEKMKTFPAYGMQEKLMGRTSSQSAESFNSKIGKLRRLPICQMIKEVLKKKAIAKSKREEQFQLQIEGLSLVPKMQLALLK
mmetsp:Transcript_8293/g.22034  ORF Transcript_8293/g.22034 Transcript_8293/m.22034 type:complete len:145 (-) Transcript_8293:1121-1555(-)